ncbi:anhydro-N-acetylmuramic acid kinase [Zobellella aerophila]|uniref:Anhydro-N-acetylmuramic acid kinase n=1 Tax=Zobellella aerophila TaxID=870480 RepID=A0ABP6WJ71_9GAMM
MAEGNSKELLHPRTQGRYIGVMSGTSMDGVDTVLVDVNESGVTLLAQDCYPMAEALKAALLEICLGQPTTLAMIGELDHRLGHLFADAVIQLMHKAGVQAAEVVAIGCHGQTVFHAPGHRYPFTMQIGDANIIAARTGVTTVADFRRKDMAHGGQGAPLVPAFHQHLFGGGERTTIVLNIGGIANISVLAPGRPVLGYDTGPGNMLMDGWILRHHQQSYDKDAAWAGSGTVNEALLTAMLADPYFARPAPKSTGRELFNLPWLDEQLAGFRVSAADVQATLAALTARSIAMEVDKFTAGELLVCGGGVHNPLLMADLARLLPAWSVASTARRGVDPDYMEAMAFAWLARQTIHRQPGNLPEVTGASRQTSLGAIYPAE